MDQSFAENSLYRLIVRQQPSKARLCSFKEKVDRRPVDPPPIIQLKSNHEDEEADYLQNPYFFLYATLTDAAGKNDLHFVNGNRTTAGTVVQSLHKLKDNDNTDGGFFIFSDLSVRLEGLYRLKFTLFEMNGLHVNRVCSIISNIFQVYSPKSFPGMSESTFLTRSFSDQGVRIRIRKEPRISNNIVGKKRKKPTSDTEEEEARPTLPSPKEIFRTSVMSMQNLLSTNNTDLIHTRILPLPLPSPWLPQNNNNLKLSMSTLKNTTNNNNNSQLQR